MTVSQLVDADRIEATTPDPINARNLLAEGGRHYASALALQGTGDNGGAYSLAYDASRKACTAAMMAAGYRVKPNRLGHHAAVGAYAELAFPADAAVMTKFDDMRRKRNNSEYRVHQVSDAELQRALDASRDILSVMEAAAATW